MELLADESVDYPIVGWLREQGHNVIAVADSCAGSTDNQVLQLAISQQRVLVTFDRHFGELVFRRQIKPPGLIYVRIRASSASEMYRRFHDTWPVVETKVLGRFIVVSTNRIRLRAL